MSAEEFFAAVALSKLCTSKELLHLMCTHYCDTLTVEKPHEKYERFDIDNFSNSQYCNLFRFKKDDMLDLSELLCLPSYTSHTDLSWTPLEGTAMLLRRLSYPGRLADLAPYFGHSPSECSLMFNSMLADVHHRHLHHMSVLNQPWMDHERYAAVIHNKGAPVSNVFGFINGMLRHICRPIRGQREMFSGHKRRHGLKSQHVMLPNGIVAHSFGPYPGSRHDAAMYGVSGVEQLLTGIQMQAGTQMAIYGDAAYPLHPWLLTPYQGNNLTQQQSGFNASMNPLRTCVEWGFAKLCTHFSFLNFFANLKMLLQPIGLYFSVATLLMNCHTCLYGSETSQFFALDPPPLDLYLT